MVFADKRTTAMPVMTDSIVMGPITAVAGPALPTKAIPVQASATKIMMNVSPRNV
jgi:hypothetical protein